MLNDYIFDACSEILRQIRPEIHSSDMRGLSVRELQGALSDKNLQKLITAVSGWLENVEFPAHVSFWKRDGDEIWYEAMLSAGNDEYQASKSFISRTIDDP